MLNSCLKFLDLLSNQHEFRVKMLWPFRGIIITRETYHNRVVTIYSKRPRDALHNTKLSNTILQPNCLMCSLITHYVLCLYSWSSCKCLLNTFLRDSSLSQHKYASRCRFEIIWTTTIIRIRVSCQFKAIRPSKSQHIIFGTLQISHDLFSSLPMR